MNKGVALRVQIVIASTPTATADPEQLGPAIATQVLTAGIQAGTAPYKVTLQKPAALAAGAAPSHSATVSAQLYVAGDAPPADDFVKIGQSVVARLFAAGKASYPGPFALTLGAVEALEGSDADDDGDDGDDSDA